MTFWNLACDAGGTELSRLTGLRVRATMEDTAGLRRALRMTSPPTKPVAPVTMSFILRLGDCSAECGELLKSKHESWNGMKNWSSATLVENNHE